jgi:hypothetical protein
MRENWIFRIDAKGGKNASEKIDQCIYKKGF